MSELRGKDFMAVVTLRTRDGVVARPGERCDHVPADSLQWLLDCKRIKPVEPVKKGKA
jgi:hypothetical protein